MFSGSGEDTYVLGDAENVFYSGNAEGDFARIEDFEVGVDLIRLNGDNPEGYGFSNDVSGNGLISFNDDLIAAFIGVDIGAVLGAPSFEFVS